MTIIDQRILIPAGQAVVWELVSDLARNPRWQVDCKNVSFLTSLRQGPGTRWRTTHSNGHESVQEITAWYDGLGYEYTYVDGVPYKENKGRLRLQEIAEGTVVQWTFTYEMSGMIGGLRNSLSVKRQVETVMIDSLKSLWRTINQSGSSQPFHEAKSLMRDALDYEQRVQYRPRHRMIGSEREARPEQPAPSLRPAEPIIPEPPISEEDTRPRPAVAVAKTESAEPLPGDPDFLFRPAALQPPEEEPAEPLPSTMSNAPEPVTALPPAAEVEPTPEPSRPKVEPKLETVKLRPIQDTSQMDTSKLSIWEVFGLPRPSETQEMRTVQIEQESTLTEPEAQAPPAAESVEIKPEVAAPPASVEPPKIVETLPQPVPPVQLSSEPTPPPQPVVSQPLPVSTIMPRLGLRIKQRRGLVKLRRIQ